MKLLDTSFLLGYLSGEEDVRRYLENADSTFCTTTINVAQLSSHHGGLLSSLVLDELEWLEVVPITTDVAFEAGQIGDENPSVEAFIGAVASVRGIPVVTANGDVYDSLGIEYEEY